LTVVAIITELTVTTASVVSAVTLSRLIVTDADRLITVTVTVTRHTTYTTHTMSYNHTTHNLHDTHT